MSMTSKPTASAAGSLIMVLLLAVAGLALQGCASTTTKPADYLATNFNSQAIETITLLPVVDGRADQSEELKLDKWVLTLSERAIKQRGYACTVVRDRAFVSAVTRSSLESPSRGFITALGPASSNWVLVMVLEEFSSSTGFGSSGAATMSGYLFDKQSGSVIWHDRSVKQLKSAGLMGIAMKDTVVATAIQKAATQTLETLPVRTR